MSHFFIDRPIFATVLSIVIVIMGAVSLLGLPVAQYPEVTPPTVSITTTYPGASAQVVADTVATPIEQQVNGVENMLYMSSRSTNDGRMTLDVTFELGTDVDFAQVLTQNRVAIALPQLPEEVTRQGVTTKKKSPSILLCVNLISPDERYDQLYMSNYATINIKDALARVKGVGDVTFLGGRDYSMRIWLDPNKLAQRNMTASDVVNALREQNLQVAAGVIGQPPAPKGQEFQYTVNTLGRLLNEKQFQEVIVKTGVGTEIVRVKDIGRVELGAQNYDVSSYLDGAESITLAVFQLPGSNALETAESIRQEMEKLKARFPQGLDYRVVYDTTVFVEESIAEVYKTLFEAVFLVFIVVLVFLQDWRTTIIPMVAVPVSLVGTFFIMNLLGFSLNNLSLFGLVLAIGIVVDDAIVVVENVDRWMAKGLSANDAAHRAMSEVTGPIVATSLVLVAVFVPTAFIAGISGQFYKQFALTIAASTIISTFNALTLSPALCALLLKNEEHVGKVEGAATSAPPKEPLPRVGVMALFGLMAVYLFKNTALNLAGVDESSWPQQQYLVMGLLFLVAALVGGFVAVLVSRALIAFFVAFNLAYDKIQAGYTSMVRGFLRVAVIALAVYAGLMGLTVAEFSAVPVGFIPQQDKGYLIVNAQLPDGSSLQRTEAVMEELTAEALKTPGVDHVISVPGYSALTSINLSNAGTMFVTLTPFEERAGKADLYSDAIAGKLRAEFYGVLEAIVGVFGAPPVEGLGSTGGFKLQIENRGSEGPAALQAAVTEMTDLGNSQPGLVGLFSSYRADQPQLYVDIDRTKAKTEGIALDDIFKTLQVYLGSAYVNDFTQFGRNWQVLVQADSDFRNRRTDIGKLKVRNASGEMIPLAALVNIKEISGPAVVNRYNMYPSAEITGGTAPGFSSGQAISLIERLAEERLPRSMSFEWTELTLLQILAGNTAVYVFMLGTLLVFLVLSAQYESWSMPLAIVLIVPMCLLSAITGVFLTGSENNIFTQIGLVVLIGLAAKNAILIVEFAKQQQDEGLDRFEASVEACRLRLRPILMTSFSFILGVLPLLLATGAGAEMRTALGLCVFSGMLGVTLFGPFFTPVFYLVIRWMVERGGTSSRIVRAETLAAAGVSPDGTGKLSVRQTVKTSPPAAKEKKPPA